MTPSSFLLTGAVRVLVGAHARWIGCAPSEAQRIYFANHTSHIDTIAIWSALPVRLRRRTRPVAARDYWSSGFRGSIARRALNAVLVDRQRTDPDSDPLAPLNEALAAGDSLIIFPEGTRRQERLPGEFKSGIFRLSEKFPQVELVPVYLDNLYRAMPKGRTLPVPLSCAVRFGTPIARLDGETKDAFLGRARDAVIALA